MKLRKIYDKISEHYRNLDLSIVKESARAMTIGGYITAEDYFDDEIYMEIFIGESFAVTCVFDRIDRTKENYDLINEFNEKSLLYRAYISQRGEDDQDYLILESSSIGYSSEKEQAQAIIQYVGSLLDESTIDILQRLTKETY